MADAVNVWEVQPKAGFCVKFREVTGGKLFVNVCVCDELPQPNQLLDEVTRRHYSVLLDDESRCNEYLIPISVSDVHDAIDHTGSPCRKLDALINAKFFESCVKGSELFQMYVVTVTSGIIDQKYALGVCQALRDNRFVILKNKRSVGDLRPQSINKKPGTKAKIIELDDDYTASSSNSSKPSPAPAKTKSPTSRTTKPMPVGEVTERSTSSQKVADQKTETLPLLASIRQPQYKIMSRVREEDVKLRVLECEFYLSLIDDLKDIDFRVDPSESVLSLRCKDVYALDLKMPERVSEKGVVAEFDPDSHVMKLVLNVV